MLQLSPEKVLLTLVSVIGVMAQVAFLLAAQLDAHRLAGLKISAILRGQVGPFWIEEWGALLILFIITVLLGWSLFVVNNPRTPIGSFGAGIFTGMELYIELCALLRFLRRRDVMNGRPHIP